jgi:hypothetical protein
MIVNAIIVVKVSEIISVCPIVPRWSYSKNVAKVSPKTVEKAIVSFFLVSTSFIECRFLKWLPTKKYCGWWGL